MQIKPVDTFDYVVFGATGDLTMRKLLPALYYRFRDKQFSEQCRIIGTARSPMDDDGFRARAAEALEQHVPKEDRDKPVIRKFLDLLHYVRGDATAPGGLEALAKLLGGGEDRVRVFYLATSPDLYGPTSTNLAGRGSAEMSSTRFRLLRKRECAGPGGT